eukprot:6211097-Pleurochrysis_carterae.AAC.3
MVKLNLHQSQEGLLERGAGERECLFPASRRASPWCRSNKNNVMRAQVCFLTQGARARASLCLRHVGQSLCGCHVFVTIYCVRAARARNLLTRTYPDRTIPRKLNVSYSCYLQKSGKGLWCPMRARVGVWVQGWVDVTKLAPKEYVWGDEACSPARLGGGRVCNAGGR